MSNNKRLRSNPNGEASNTTSSATSSSAASTPASASAYLANVPVLNHTQVVGAPAILAAVA